MNELDLEAKASSIGSPVLLSNTLDTRYVPSYGGLLKATQPVLSIGTGNRKKRMLNVVLLIKVSVLR